MLTRLGEKATQLFEKYMPNAFVFALALTPFTALIAFLWTGTSPLNIVESWYKGFWSLLEFGMQIILIIITGFAIALSPIVNNGIDRLTKYINTPKQVYFFVVLIGAALSLISFGWIVITCVLARELAMRVKGVNYPFLIACVYFSGGSWVTGLSSSIPLLLGTEDNYLIEAGVLSSIIPTSVTLGSCSKYSYDSSLFGFCTTLNRFPDTKGKKIQRTSRYVGVNYFNKNTNHQGRSFKPELIL